MNADELRCHEAEEMRKMMRRVLAASVTAYAVILIGCVTLAGLLLG